MSFRAVIFDWRGTLVTTPSESAWIHRSLSLLGRPTDRVDSVSAAIRSASGPEDRLEAPGVDSDAELHRHTYLDVFRDAGLDEELAEALYAVESDARHNRFAVDVADTLHSLHAGGVRIAVLSDIHFDIRPAFAAAGLVDLVDVFTLSFEQGIQKPDPRMFHRTLAALEVTVEQALMVGDRSGPDGAAVEQGITTLLLPPLTSVDQTRLHGVLALCPAARRAPATAPVPS